MNVSEVASRPTGTLVPGLNYRNLNVFGPWVMIAFYLATATYGVLVAMPALYTDAMTLRGMQALACYCFLQLTAHWFTTRSQISAFNKIKSSNSVRGNHEDTPKTRHDSRHLGRDSEKSHGKQEADQTKDNKSYWSWHYCSKCHIFAPPRCHHCTLCDQCVLKRNHHCFLTGVCIGLNNYRYFLVFISWAVITVTFGLLHMYLYIYFEIFPKISLVDFFPMVCFIRGLCGKVPLYISALCLIFWGLNLFAGVSYVIFFDIARTTFDGRTKFEMEKGLQVVDSRPVTVRLSQTLGEYWGLNFVLPFARGSKCLEDGLSWPTVSVVKSRGKKKLKKVH